MTHALKIPVFIEFSKIIPQLQLITVWGYDDSCNDAQNLHSIYSILNVQNGHQGNIYLFNFTQDSFRGKQIVKGLKVKNKT